MPHGVAEARGDMACPVCAEEDCVLHRGVLWLAQLVNVIAGLAALFGSMAVAWAWVSGGSTF
jgi:hypothetical protein